MSMPFRTSAAHPELTRRTLLQATAALGAIATAGQPWSTARGAAPLLTVGTKTLEVNGKPAKVFSVEGPGKRTGVFANEGDRFSGALLNASSDPLQMHWHGQVKAPFDQDRARPGGGALATGATDMHDFELTPGTHWMHSHTLTEQQLLAAPMIAREKDAGDVQDVVIMLHDFAFRTPQEILAELGGSDSHSAHGAGGGSTSSPPAGHTPHGPGPKGDARRGSGSGSGSFGGSGSGSGSGHMMGMAHANDVRYDAYLANDRTLADPEIIKVEKGGRVRLRIINGGTATAFFISTPGLKSTCVAVDGTPCQPLSAQSYPLAQGQRIDLTLSIPPRGGTFPVLAQVEAATFQTGVILATPGQTITKLRDAAKEPTPLVDLAFEAKLRAKDPLAVKRPDKSFMLVLGEQPGYRWTINNRIHGEHEPFIARQGDRVVLSFMNPTSMMHPMHMHGHHFQVVGIGGQSIAGPLRDTVIVPPHMPVTVAFDATNKGQWFLHCHHLYHMATGMMTEVHVV